MARYATHKFFCMNCGNEGIPIMRKEGHQHARMHRKKLYCIHCKTEVNHMECKTYADVMDFKENFENGVYKDEAEESISFVRSTRLG